MSAGFQILFESCASLLFNIASIWDDNNISTTNIINIIDIILSNSLILILNDLLG